MAYESQPMVAIKKSRQVRDKSSFSILITANKQRF